LKRGKGIPVSFQAFCSLRRRMGREAQKVKDDYEPEHIWSLWEKMLQDVTGK
jgi:hypothetical protein